MKVVNKIGLKHIIIADKDLHVAEWSCLMLTTTQQGDNDKGKLNKKSILKFSFENVIIVLCDKSRHVNNIKLTARALKLICILVKWYYIVVVLKTILHIILKQ